MQFRRATTQDIAALSQLVNRAYRPAPEHAGWTHENGLVSGERINHAQLASLLTQPNGQVLLGCHGQQIVACVHIENAGNYGYVGMLAVDPTCQTGGLGKAMLAHAEQQLQAQYNVGRSRMTVLTSRPELRAFYLRRGYTPTGERLPFPLEAGVGELLRADLELEVLEKQLGQIEQFTTPEKQAE